ncbi:UDP-glucose 4-epimerase [Tardiphaga sp. OK246]|uniref:NAD-dependent epimerase/dehydratase family protein n=1 Tax=Tardiphaga sp. OK246 TaxID=1855307 RepID=UPI000B6A3B65|nr:NAD-dependent epimerase/dehydratase family protein [Tardiphaga sp. OK246]SNT63978.1 UDP-glucose 4-epimerase [Tardiphaga sp. OK246]
MKRFLVVGGAGFIGSSLIEQLVCLGHDVRAVDRPVKSSPLPAMILRSVEWLEGDFTDVDFIARAVKDRDVVFHLASTTLPKSSNDDPVYDIRTNIVGTVQLLDVATRAGVGKVIFPSSGGTVYGNPMALPIREAHPTNPISSYGITKLTIEKYLEFFRQERGLDYTALRLANPYGHYHNAGSAQGAVGVFLSRAMAGQPIEIWGDGEVVRDYIYISDVIDAMIASITYQAGARVFNLGSGMGKSLNEVVAAVQRATGRTVAVNFLPKRSVDVQANILDISLIGEEMKWKPTVSFDQGVALLFDQFQRSPHVSRFE